MVMATEVTKQKSSIWEAIYSQPNEFESVAWAKRLREAAFDQFKELGFPTVKDEEWKYTNVAPLTKLSFQTARDESDSSVTAANVNQLGVVEAKNSQLVFVNGVLRRDLSSLADVPAGVIAIGLDEAIKEPAYEEVIREYLGRGVGYN